jgi:hypothetical protein
MSIAISVGATVAEGRLRSAGRIATKPEALELFGQSLDPRDLVALEVTGNAWAIARILEPHGARVIVVSPSDTGIRRARAKTDRLDARALARLCGRDTWMGWGPRMSASGRCAVGWRAARSWSVPGRARRTMLTRCWCAV